MADEKKKTVSVADVMGKEDKTSKPKSESKTKTEPKAKKTKHKHMHVENHFDEKGNSTGHTVRYTPDGGGPEVSHAASDLDAVHDSMEQHMGDANADEGQEMPQGGGQEPQAQPMPGQGA